MASEYVARARKDARKSVARAAFLFASPSFESMAKRVAPSLVVSFSLALLLLAGCLSRSLTGLTVLPAAGSVSVLVGQTSQFQAQAVYTESGHATTFQNLTNEVTWVSSNTAVATINSSGLATGLSAGTATITGSMQGSFGPISAGSSITVTTPTTTTGTTGTTLARVLTALAVIPGAQTVTAMGETAQFIAIGTWSSGTPATSDVTDLVSWRSSDSSVAQVNASGLVTTIGGGQATITALATSSDGSVTSASGAITANANAGTVTLPTLTVYKVGSGTGTVQGYPVSGATVGAVVINCGSGTACTGSFPLGTQVMLVPTAASGSQFDGWSANCVTPASPSIYYPNSCSVTLKNNDTVGAIFDPTP